MSKNIESLERLAAGIRQKCEEAEGHARSAVAAAREAGAMLIEAKGIAGHGNWLPWLAENCGMSERTAQGYMKLARLDEVKAQRVAYLPLRAALREIAKPDALELFKKILAADLAACMEWNDVADLATANPEWMAGQLRRAVADLEAYDRFAGQLPPMEESIRASRVWQHRRFVEAHRDLIDLAA